MLCKLPILCGAIIAMTFAGKVTWNFDDVMVDQIPLKWKAERTGQTSSPAVWKVVTDATAPSASHVLSLTDFGSTTTKDYSLCWTDSVKCADLEIIVQCKNSGGANNNSGICWRVKDKDNYYCVRASSDEGNFTCYYVSNGIRNWLTEEYLKVPSNQWRTIKLVQKGSQIILSIDGLEKINLTDTHISGAGGVGVWTKGQGVISFDNFSVTSDEIPITQIKGRSGVMGPESLTIRPINGIQTLHFNSVQPRIISVELYFMNGVKAVSIFYGALAAGNHDIALENGKTQLPDGQYVCSVKMGLIVTQHRFSVAR